MLDINIEERGESFYNKMIPGVLDELVEKEIAVESEGALCIFQDKEGPPLICKKRDGGFNYASTDLAAMWQRINDVGADWIIYVTDVGQNKVRHGEIGCVRARYVLHFSLFLFLISFIECIISFVEFYLLLQSKYDHLAFLSAAL